MTRAGNRELDAAGITDPELRVSYEACRTLNAQHGKTYFLATALLPARKRPDVHALYGFARYADEIVDDLADTSSPADKAARLKSWGAAFLRGEGDDAVLPAIQHTRGKLGIEAKLFEDFLDSMAMDLTVGDYATYADLMTYVWGSAAVIGLQMLPVLQPLPGVAEDAKAYAADLGIAFQLSNFLRDIGEDLQRGRLYLPLEDLSDFGVERAQLEAGIVDGRVRRLLAFEIARARELYRNAWQGIRLLEPTSRPCMETAWQLYGGILDRIEAADYRVLDRRVSVPTTRRLGVALPAYARAVLARRPARRSVSIG